MIRRGFNNDGLAVTLGCKVNNFPINDLCSDLCAYIAEVCLWDVVVTK